MKFGRFTFIRMWRLQTSLRRFIGIQTTAKSEPWGESEIAEEVGGMHEGTCIRSLQTSVLTPVLENIGLTKQEAFD